MSTATEVLYDLRARLVTDVYRKERDRDLRGSEECPTDCIEGVRFEVRPGFLDACPICRRYAKTEHAHRVVELLLVALAVQLKDEGGTTEVALANLLDAPVRVRGAMDRGDTLRDALDDLVDEVEAALPNPKRKGLKAALTRARKVLEDE